MNSLKNIGINNTSLDWFKSYIKERHQIVQINNKSSNKLELTRGLGQGTCLSPILFNIYSIDIVKANINCQIIAFADDMTLFIAEDNWEKAFKKMELDINNIKKICVDKELVFNEEKTKYMTFLTNDQNNTNFDIKIHKTNCLRNDRCICYKITKTDSHKFLGVQIDTNLKWENHIINVINRLRKLIHKFYSLRNILHKKLMRSVYFALAQSVIQYGFAIWGGTFQNKLTPLYIIQKYLIKICLNKNKRFPTNEIFIEFDVLPLNLLFVKLCTKFYLLNKSEWDEFHQIQIIHNHCTRNKTRSLAQTIRVNTTFSQRNILYLGPKFYNKFIKDNNTKPEEIETLIKSNRVNLNHRINNWLKKMLTENKDIAYWNMTLIA